MEHLHLRIERADDAGSSSSLYLLNPDCRCINPNNINDRVLNPAAWQDVAPGTISPGSLYYNDYRGPHQINENAPSGVPSRVKRAFQVEHTAPNSLNMFNR